jgi:hypothetical protein
MNSEKLKIVFSGMVAGDPHQGGATWAVLQYVLGLRELGHEVLLVEPVNCESLRPSGSSLEYSTNTAYFRAVVREFGLVGQAALLLNGKREAAGLPYGHVAAFANDADLLLNVSGMLDDPELIGAIATRVYLDLDPAFVQIWHDAEGIDMRLDAHTDFVTVGLGMGSTGCTAPDCGRVWTTTLQPVVLSQWPRGDAIRYDVFTTVGNWRGYGSVEYRGELLGQKAHSMRELITLPRRSKERFLLAMGIHPDETADLEVLRANGWQLVEPKAVAATPAQYRQFLQGSKAEIGVAKSGYVKSRCGWFSDRSACYLASGRPVVAQDTGFSDYLETGAGLLAFDTVDEAVDCIDRINDDYTMHSVAARTLAEEHFASAKVLNRLLDSVGVPV